MAWSAFQEVVFFFPLSEAQIEIKRGVYKSPYLLLLPSPAYTLFDTSKIPNRFLDHPMVMVLLLQDPVPKKVCADST
jgi:hypothetical protein